MLYLYHRGDEKKENNNGKGIFYGVIGIATLIVAIVGATFAYFTATAQSEEGAINVTSYSGFSVSLSLNKVAPSVSVNKLIPLDSAQYLTSALSHVDVNNASQPCIDINGDQDCAIYVMVLTNNGNSEVDVVGYLSADENNYETDNLKYQIFNCEDGTDDNTIVDIFTPISGSVAVNAPKFGADVTSLPRFVVGENMNTTIKIAGKEEGLDAPTARLCLVIWLEEAKNAEGKPVEQNNDQNRTFAGKETFNATTGSGEVLEANFN